MEGRARPCRLAQGTLPGRAKAPRPIPLLIGTAGRGAGRGMAAAVPGRARCTLCACAPCGLRRPPVRCRGLPCPLVLFPPSRTATGLPRSDIRVAVGPGTNPWEAKPWAAASPSLVISFVEGMGTGRVMPNGMPIAAMRSSSRPSLVGFPQRPPGRTVGLGTTPGWRPSAACAHVPARHGAC